MAVASVPDFSRVVLTLDNGTDEFGKPVTVSKTFTGIKAEADDQDVYDVAAQLAALQTHPVVSIERIDREQLTA